MVPSTSGESRGVQISVHAGSPLAEVFLIDHTFALVRRSLGDLTTVVDPGIYKVKVRLGDAEAERLVMCDHDLVVDVSDELVLPKPATTRGLARPPLRDPVHRRDLGPTTPGTPEATAEVVLVTGPQEGRAAPPLARLLDDHARAVLEAKPAGGDLTSAGAVSLKPGTYYLRRRLPSEVEVEQLVPVVSGWQTQVILLEERDAQTDLGGTRASMVMARTGQVGGGADLRHSEELRAALAEERKVAAHGLDDLLERSENPLVLLFGAHLMLLARDTQKKTRSRARPQAPVHFDQTRFVRLVDRLSEMLGRRHPDTVALSTQLDDARLDLLEPVASPPMLWRGWQLLLEASNDVPHLVGVNLWRRTVAVLPFRPFLVWSVDDSARAAARVEAEIVRSREFADDSRHWRRELTTRLLVPRAVIDLSLRSR